MTIKALKPGDWLVPGENFGGAGPALPAFRCDNCDNGVELEWEYCAWCGATKDWVPVKSDDDQQSQESK